MNNIDNDFLNQILFFGIPKVLIIVPLAIGIFKKVRSFQKNKRCTVKTSATVIKIYEKKKYHEDANGFTDEYTVYSPRITYNVHGIDYEYTHKVSRNKLNYSVGKILTVFYNENNPTEVYIQGDSNQSGTTFIIVGCLFLVMQLFTAWYLGR